jgi:subtilase family serine protease
MAGSAVGRLAGRSPRLARRSAVLLGLLVGLLPLGGASLAGSVEMASGRTGGGSARSGSGGAAGAVEQRPADPAELIDFQADLLMPGYGQVAALAAAVADPASPEYRQFITPAEFGARFGLPGAAITTVVDWFEARGFSVRTKPANRSAIGLRGTAAELERALGVDLVDLSDGGSGSHLALTPAVVPASLRPYVTAISGLDTSLATRPKPHFGPADGLRPADLAKAYGLAPLRAEGLDGSGQAIAVVSFDTFDPKDIAAFDKVTGISGPAVQAIRLPGAAKKPGDSQTEVSLDLETIRAIAPKAQIYDYEAPQSADWSDIIDRIVEDHKAQIVSVSWGLCEPLAQPAVGDPDDVALASAELAGLSIFVSSGDSGAYDCLNSGDGNQRDFRLAADYPAVSPHVIAVGGTYLSLHQDGSFLGEAAWQDPLGQSGSGGGLSTVFPRPSWQAGPGVVSSASNGRRQVPDVAGPADPASGLFVVSGGQAEEVGGTSAATPFWAGSMVLAAQLAATDGISGLGFLDPVLYSIAAAHQGDGSMFHDITVGANLHYPATAGWDFATGWGSPRLDSLVPAIVAYLQAHPR